MASKEYYIPPVQPIAQAPNQFGGQAPQPKPAPGQFPGQVPGQHDEAEEEKVIEGLMILVGGLAEALIAKGVLSEEDIHNGIASVQQGGASDVAKSAPELTGNKMSSGSHGFPGGADTDKGMGAENGKSQGK